MHKKNNVLLYKIIATCCVIMLCGMQLLHVKNLYKLENEKFESELRKNMKVGYEKTVVNDKVFPGGVPIIDSVIYTHYDSLHKLRETDTSAYNLFAEKVCDTLFERLAAKNNMDSIFEKLKVANGACEDMTYALLVEALELASAPNVYHNMFEKTPQGRKTGKVRVDESGARVGGTLNSLNQQNLISSIKVTSSSARSYKIAFALYGDRPDRFREVFLKMLPEASLSILSIIAILLIFLFTFNNWVKQKKLSEMKSDFINTITHEFQTPLTAIMIANKTIENENAETSNDKITALNNVIRRQTERLSTLVKQVAETSDEKAIVLNFVPCHVNELLDEILSDYRLNISGSEATVTLVKEAKNDNVLLDRLHFTSIILNLLSNAIKYNQKPVKEITITTALANVDTLTISIKDNGEGMSDEVMRNMFDRFYRNPSLTDAYQPGLGLGLYYTRECLDAHEWQYKVYSKAGKGTEFIIYMPLQSEYKNASAGKKHIYKV